MASFLTKKDRNVVPRWRDFRSTLQLGELKTSATAGTQAKLQFDLSDLVENWISNPTLSVAADLLSAAQVSGQAHVARDAADFVLENTGLDPDSSIYRSALFVRGLNDNITEANKLVLPAERPPSRRVADARKILASNPDNAVLWTDLSLLYTRLGSLEKAKRAMMVATSLAPHNRFVLRCAARLYIHLDEEDRAHDLLKRSPLIKIDPWIASAEIATAMAAGKSAVGVDFGRKLLAGERFSSIHTTELSTALATLEWHSGNLRNTRRLLRQGLQTPNENSLAQAKWITTDIHSERTDFDVANYDVSRRFEANAIQAFEDHKWDSVVLESLQWLDDQPFSSRPVSLTAYMYSTVFENYDAAIEIVKRGQIANPSEPDFHISLAFSYASSNRTKEAKEELGKIKTSIKREHGVSIPANKGLIAYREGDIESGRRLYSQAVQKAEEMNNKAFQAQALIFWAREELLAGTDGLEDVLERAGEAVKHSTSVDAKYLLKRVILRYAAQKEGKALSAPDNLSGNIQEGVKPLLPGLSVRFPGLKSDS